MNFDLFLRILAYESEKKKYKKIDDFCQFLVIFDEKPENQQFFPVIGKLFLTLFFHFQKLESLKTS